MKSRLPFDEIEALRKRISVHFDAQTGQIKSRQDCEDIIDELLDLYLLFYAAGVNSVNEQFGTSEQFSSQEVQETVYKRVDGATWRDRVLAWYATGGTIDDIMRIADTEAHRIGNEAAYDTAIRAGATSKTWLTMLDDRVRDTHVYLESVSVPIGAKFYTYDGDSADIPGVFSKPENNINCRCELRFE